MTRIIVATVSAERNEKVIETMTTNMATVNKEIIGVLYRG
jgi:hypothetical protein